jgi:branched-subunit amino acid aminotransferase/4-amino-4-deoxychorismate lyase
VTAWVDGKVVADGALPRRAGVAPFETIGARGGGLPLWDRHLARLRGAVARLGLGWREPASLRAAAMDLLRANDRADGVLRLAVVPTAHGVSTALVARAKSPVQVVKLLPTVVERPADAPPGDLKAEPRGYYDAVRQQAQDGKADDGLVLAGDGALLETALGNLWLFVDGGWVTPALDGRVLPGIARALLCDGLRARGLAVDERVCDLGDLHRAQALAVSNAVHGPRPACLVDQPADAAPTARDLQPVWRAAFGG